MPAASFGRHSALCAQPFLDPAWLCNAAIAGGLRGDRNVERAAHPVQHVDHGGRPVTPADAHPAQTEDLRKCAGHDRVVGGVDQPIARIVVGAQ